MTVNDPEVVRQAMLQLRPMVLTFDNPEALHRLRRVSEIWESLYDHFFPPALPRRLPLRSNPVTQYDQGHSRSLSIYDPVTQSIRRPPGLPPPPRAESLQQVPRYSVSSGTVSFGTDLATNSTPLSQTSSRTGSAPHSRPPTDPHIGHELQNGEEMFREQLRETSFQSLRADPAAVPELSTVQSHPPSTAALQHDLVDPAPQVSPNTTAGSTGIHLSRLAVSSDASRDGMAVSTPSKSMANGPAQMEMTSLTPSTINPSTTRDVTSGLGSSIADDQPMDTRDSDLPLIENEMALESHSADSAHPSSSNPSAVALLTKDTVVSPQVDTPTKKATKLAGKAASSSSKKRSRDKQRQNAKLGKLTGRTIAAAPIADSHQTDEEEERVDTSKKSKRTPEPKAQPHQQESRSSSGDSAQENRSTAGGSQGLAPRPANQGCSSTSRPTPLSEPNTANFQHDLTQRSLWEQQVYRDHQAYLAARPTTLPTTPASGGNTGTPLSSAPFLAASPSSLLHRVLTTAKPPSTSLQPAAAQSSGPLDQLAFAAAKYAVICRQRAARARLRRAGDTIFTKSTQGQGQGRSSHHAPAD